MIGISQVGGYYPSRVTPPENGGKTTVRAVVREMRIDIDSLIG